MDNQTAKEEVLTQGDGMYTAESWKSALWETNPYKSIDLYTELLEKYPDSTAIYNNRGLRFLKTKQYEKAVDDFKKGLELDEYDVNLLRHLAKAYAYMEDFNNAFEQVDKAIFTNEKDYSSKLLKAEILMRQSKMTSALEEIEQLLLYADFEHMVYEKCRLYFLLGIIYFVEDNTSKAEENFKLAFSDRSYWDSYLSNFAFEALDIKTQTNIANIITQITAQ